ncbi:hypothetical protein M2138_000864 [Dysgonomonadaceae bacterium PH5-43]|nr:hypothetical protein [Dysgonomonadaceae bacterium PH5-43]
MKRNKIKRTVRKVITSSFLLLCLSFCIVFNSYTQEEQKDNLNMKYQSLMFSIGNSNIYDSYLSPLQYKGSTYGLAYESIKMTKLLQNKVSLQHLIDLNVANTYNPARNAKNYFASLDYRFGMHYRFNPMKDLFIFGGLQANGLIGGIYNTRNTNNPATAKAHINLNVSGLASYGFNVGKQPFLIRYQIDLPVMGGMFSPQFGQSYYEIYLDVDAQLYHFSSLHNHREIRNLLSLDIPLKHCTLRLSYSNWVYETEINDLNTKIISNSFCVGFSRNIFGVSGKKSKKYYNPFINAYSNIE